MADNTTLPVGSGGDIISTDVITTLNGSTIATGEKAQRVKVGWGVDATFTDTTAANPLPVVQTGTSALPTGAATAANQATEITSLATIAAKNNNSVDSTVTGTITAADAVVAAPTGNGVPVSGASTAGSIVSIQSNGGTSSWLASITGSISGSYYFEISNNSTNGTNGTWINVNGRQTGLGSSGSTINYFTTTTGEFRGNAASSTWYRVRNVGGTSPNTTVVLSLSTGTGAIFLNSALPSGTNRIGTFGLNDGTNNFTLKPASTAPISTDTAVVIATSPNSPDVTSLSTIATNTGNGATAANQTNGNQQTKITNGTNVADVSTGDSGYKGIATASNGLTIPFTTVGTGAQIVGPFTVAGFSTINVQFTSVGSGVALTGQFSLDGGTTWNQMITWQALGSTVSISSNITSTANLFRAPISGPLFRLQYTSITSGTSSGNIYLSNAPLAPTTMGVAAAQNGTWSFGPNTNTGTATPGQTLWTGVLGSASTLQGMYSIGRAGDAYAGDQALAVGIEGYNGSTYDRFRFNTTGSIITAGATTAQTSTTQVSYNAKKLHVVINISAFTSGTLTFTVNAITSSGYTYPLLLSPALAATGTTVLRIFPGANASANAVANDIVPRSFNVVVSGTFVATYGVDYNLGV